LEHTQELYNGLATLAKLALEPYISGISKMLSFNDKTEL